MAAPDVSFTQYSNFGGLGEAMSVEINAGCERIANKVAATARKLVPRPPTPGGNQVYERTGTLAGGISVEAGGPGLGRSGEQERIRGADDEAYIITAQATDDKGRDYAMYVEFPTNRRPHSTDRSDPRFSPGGWGPFLRPAIEDHRPEYIEMMRKIVNGEVGLRSSGERFDVRAGTTGRFRSIGSGRFTRGR